MATTTTAISAEGIVRSMKICNNCKNRGMKRRCDLYTSMSTYAEKCKDFEEKKQTNADRIRSFSDEEFAEFLEKILRGNRDEIGINCGNSKCEEWKCTECISKWLQSEVEE